MLTAKVHVFSDRQSRAQAQDRWMLPALQKMWKSSQRSHEK